MKKYLIRLVSILLGYVEFILPDYHSLRSWSAVILIVFINLVPIWAMVLSTAILRETITLPLVIGAAMVIGGVFLTSRS